VVDGKTRRLLVFNPQLGFSFAKYTNSRKPAAGGHFVH